MVNQQLMDFFEFDQADLEANQAGNFTQKQTTRILSEDKSRRTVSRIGGIVVLLMAAAGFFIALFAGIQTPDWGSRIGFGLGFGCIWPLVWGGLGYWLLANSFSKHVFRLARVQGYANIVRTVSHNSKQHTTIVRHQLHIGGTEFSVQAGIANVMMQDKEYIIYYIADSSEILSAEAV